MDRATSADGVSLSWHSQGVGPPVLLLGGALGDHAAWAGVVARLAGASTVHALDRRGRGTSEDRPGSGADDEVVDVLTVLDRVDQGGGVLLVGHSSGALLALRAAARSAPGRVRAVVAYEPAPPPSVTASPRLRDLVDGGRPDEATARFLVDTVGLPEDAARAEVTRMGAGEAARLGRSVPHDAEIAEQGLPAAELAAVDAPVTLLLGGESPDLMARHVDAVASALPRATVRTLPGQGHFALSSAPHLVADAVAAAL